MRIDNRPLIQQIADAHWQPVKKSDNRSDLERGIEEKESQLSGKRLHGDRLVLHLAKQEQRSRDDAFDEQERKREHLERRRTELARLQTLKERYEENESIPVEMIVAVDHAIQQMADPDGCEKTSSDMLKACLEVEQQRQDAIAQGIDARLAAVEAERVALQELQAQYTQVEQPVSKIQLASTTLDEQAKELFAKICTSPEHCDATDSVYESLKSHRAGDSAAIIAAIEHYGEVAAPQAESEAA